MRILPVAALVALSMTSAAAQDRPNTILVMDGSGSMWGQIDGIAKITIAQEVVGDLLQTIPDDQGLGLTVYGHRERGNCTDIETVVPPAPGTRAQIIDAVNGIKPLGKTPMTDAIIAAAEALRYTEDSATVILVSDGVETCNPDPCAAARLLEEAGIDFTAHVVGFDVGSDPEAVAQMQCIADETGGDFLTADNALELGAALTAVVEEPAPAPEPVMTTLTFTALIGSEDGPMIEGPVFWDVISEDGSTAEGQTNPQDITLMEGSHTVTAYWVAQEVTSEPRQFIATADPRAITVIFEEPPLTAVVTAPDTAVAGSTIEVAWDGPGNARDVIGITPADYEDIGWPYRFANSTEIEAGNPLNLLMPTTPGDYVVEYSLREDATRIGATPITVTPAEATLTAPISVGAGSAIEVAWTGPGYRRDYIGITPLDYEDIGWPYRFSTGRALVEDGTPIRIKAPTEPGQYVIEYVFGQDDARLVSVPLEVTEVSASLTAPATVEAGQTIEVAWSGPGYANDYIGITPLDYEDIGWPYRFATGREKVEQGNPIRIQAPTEPGQYVIEYVLGQDDSRLVSVALEVTEVGASITAPASVSAGESIEVAWTGPAYSGDFIAITPADYEDIGWPYRFVTGRGHVADGSPARIMAPTEPGEYVIEYVLGQDSSRLVAVALEVTAVEATLTAPATAEAGSRIEVAWTGPAYSDDYIGITRVDYEDINWPYRFVSDRESIADGNPITILAPTEPGSYVIEYALGQDNTRLVAIPLEVTTPSARITAPASAPAGSRVEVKWSGPENAGDYLGVTAADYEDPNYTYRFVTDRVSIEDGSPATLQLPTEPGAYVIEYAYGQDNRRLIASPITVTAVEAALTAPATGAAGSTIEVAWTGPGYSGDYIGVTPADYDDPNYTYRFASDRADVASGSPVMVTLPDEPGSYVIEYAFGLNNHRLALVPIEVQ